MFIRLTLLLVEKVTGTYRIVEKFRKKKLNYQILRIDLFFAFMICLCKK